jgi:hypothetical protein
LKYQNVANTIVANTRQIVQEKSPKTNPKPEAKKTNNYSTLFFGLTALPFRASFQDYRFSF